MAPDIPFITLEEHFLTIAVANYLSSLPGQSKIPESHPHITILLQDLSTYRLPSMNSANISIQVLSHAANPVGIPPSVCTAANDEAASAIA